MTSRRRRLTNQRSGQEAPPPRETAIVKSNGLSDSTCGAMGSSAASEEDHDEAGPDRSGSTESSRGGGVLQGKRTKKTVERLDLQAPKQKEKLRMGDGAGDKLGDIPRTSYQISRMKAADLKPLHAILYDRPGKVSTMKRNLRLFNGFPFPADSEQFHRKRDKLLKSATLSSSKLKLVCTVLDLEKKGTHSDLIHRILDFLLAPKNSGKRLPVKKKRRSKKKSRPRERSSCSPKKSRTGIKSRTGSKSSAIVMDSSSDDEDEDTAAAAAQTDGEDEEERRSNSSDDEEQSSRSESDRAKKTTSQDTPTRKKRGSEELQSRKKKAAPPRPAAKVKKADSSRASSTAADSSDDDQPLIKMVRRSPSDEALKETLQTLLSDADLEEVTMKKICQQVFDKFPEHDLSSRKDFIKQTVKDIIT